MTDPVEIVDSSDDDDGAIHQTKLEPLETIFDSQYDATGITSEFKVRSDDDGSYNEMLESNGVGNQKDDSQSKDVETDTSLNVEETELDNEVTAMQSYRTKRSIRYQSEEAKSGATQSLGNKNPNKLTMMKRFRCRLCEYSSNHMGTYNRHIRTHTGEKPYQCDICRKEFPRMDTLKNHKFTHTKQNPFHCRGCRQGFSEKAKKDAHEKVCNMRRYECHICKKFVTFNKTKLKDHMRMETEMKMVAMDWKEEMFNMLAVFEHQAVKSLAIIKSALNRNGFALDPTFKQYFLHASNTRLVEAYNRFEIDSQLEGKFDFIEIDDSTDEESPNEATRYNTNTLTQLSREEGATDFIPRYQSIQQKRNVKMIRNGIKTRVGSTTIKRRHINPEINDHQNELITFHDVGDHDPTVLQTNQHGTVKNSDSNTGLKIADYPKIRLNDENRDDATNSTARSGDAILPINGNTKKASKIVLPGKGLVPKKFKCVDCGYSTNQKGNFKTHTRTHTGEKPYQCDVCRKEFTNKRSLKRHNATHINEYPFHCRCCFSGFSQKVVKDAHEKVCKMFRYECHICKKYVTLQKNLLEAHMRKHNGDKPFRCELCMKSFTSKAYLKKHLNTIHNRSNV
ncbi:zinc finger protein 37 homolog [Contarinia nasturtii]|uniref:zinc finger protein 37 homolog n=1 Tax=Contarinia nasturtii TaxID=265458 RepID=UPI0012D380AD|nr:zinc finger protein 37 homolog [Contarinia nasturtii]